MTRLRFTIDGDPVGKARPRSSARVVTVDGRPKALVHVHSDPAMVKAEHRVADAFRRYYPAHRPASGPIMLRFTAVFAIPDSWPKALREAAERGVVYHTSVPDKDNVEKLIVDGLNAVAWVDDAQVQGGGVKRYGAPPRIEVDIEIISQPAVPATPAQKRRQGKVDRGEPLAPQKRGHANRSKTNIPRGLKLL